MKKSAVADRSTSRIINQRALVDIIYESAGISKAALAARLNLSKPAVSRNVADLISMGLVEEKGEGESGKNGGRKPIMLYFNKDHRYIATVVLSFEQPVCAIGDLNYNILNQRKTQADQGTEGLMSHVAQAFDEMLNELSIPKEKLGLIVISHPGIIGWDNEVYYAEAFHLSRTGVGFKDYLQNYFGTPVLMENDMRLASIGEMTRGFDEQFENLIYVSCGIGFGASIIHEGRPYLGRNRASGEVGAFLMDDGRRVEEVVAMEGLLKRIAQVYSENGIKKKSPDFEEVVELSLSGDVLVNQVLRETGRILGNVIYNCSVLMDISTIIFGGDYSKLGPALFEGIDETVSRPFLPIHLKVLKSRVRESAGIYGGFVIGAGEILNKKLEG